MLERLGLERELADLGLRSAPTLVDHVERESSGLFEHFTPAELAAVRYTSALETGRELGFEGLTGNFDGYGISFGLMNWNIGAGSLQRLLKEHAQRFPERWRAAFGANADRFRAVLFADRGSEKANIAHHMDFVVREMTVGKTSQVREPWASHFRALARDPELQRIQVANVRRGLERAVYWCDYFNLRSARALAFMFDLVASNGGAWLTRKGSNRQALLREAMSAKKRAVGRELGEVELLLEIADVMGKTVLAKWAANVRMRKRAIALGGVYKCVSVPALGIDDAPFTTRVTERPLARAAQALPPRPKVPAPPPDPPYPPGRRCGPSGAVTRTPAAPRPQAAGAPASSHAPRLTDLPIAIGARAKYGDDEDEITNEVFFARHPERGRRAIAKDEKEAAREWIWLRDAVVRPLLARSAAEPPAPRATPASSAPAAPIGGVGPAHPALRAAIAALGKNDPNGITSRVFHALHPERGGRAIDPQREKDAMAEWWSLREGPVASALIRVDAAKTRDDYVASGAELSPLAIASRYGLNPWRIPRPKERPAPQRPDVRSIVVHTTGGGPARSARKRNRTGLDIAVAYYAGVRKNTDPKKKQDGFAHYVVHYDGTIVALYDERLAAIHAGYSPELAKTPIAQWWKSAWGPKGVTSPKQLHPGFTSPNSGSIGIELLGGTDGYGFTDAQYAALARLVKDIAHRYGLSLGEPPNAVLAGHEDVAPWTRTKPNGDPWDPFGHTPRARFSWSRLGALLRAR